MSFLADISDGQRLTAMVNERTLADAGRRLGGQAQYLSDTINGKLYHEEHQAHEGLENAQNAV